MEYSNRKKKFVFFMFLLLLMWCFFVSAVCIYHMNFDISFECIGAFDVTEYPENGCSTGWLSLRHPDYNGFYSDEILNQYRIDMDLEYDKYTYIITFGYELKQISYSYDTVKNRKILFIPKQFIGKVILLDEFKDKLYIYKIPKMDIDCDIHERNREVYFFKSFH